jgi:hypothetical protein
VAYGKVEISAQTFTQKGFAEKHKQKNEEKGKNIYTRKGINFNRKVGARPFRSCSSARNVEAVEGFLKKRLCEPLLEVK